LGIYPEFICEGGFTKTLDEIKSGVLGLSEADQKKIHHRGGSAALAKGMPGRLLCRQVQKTRR